MQTTTKTEKESLRQAGQLALIAAYIIQLLFNILWQVTGCVLFGLLAHFYHLALMSLVVFAILGIYGFISTTSAKEIMREIYRLVSPL